jgi:hypothetical protein
MLYFNFYFFTCIVKMIPTYFFTEQFYNRKSFLLVMLDKFLLSLVP